MTNKTTAGAAVTRLNAIADPARRGAAATALMAELADAITAASAVRDGAVLELRADGWSLAEISKGVGVGRARAQQIVGHASKAAGREG